MLKSRDNSAPLSTAARPGGVLLALVLLGCGLLAGGCKRHNRPGPADDVVVDAPGVSARADDDGVRVRAPLGIEVDVGADGVNVRAPGVRVTTADSGVRVRAPGVRVDTTVTGTSVDAFGVRVRAGDAQ